MPIRTRIEGGSVVSQLALARAMTAAGARISAHGIDAWFWPLDSSHGFEEADLEQPTGCSAGSASTAPYSEVRELRKLAQVTDSMMIQPILRHDFRYYP